MARTVLVISDTHGLHENLRKVLAIEAGKYDAVFHLGDVEGGEDMIRDMADAPVTFVRGNCDVFSRLPQERDFIYEGHHFLMTHGHRYFVYYDASELAAEASSRGVEVALYGHTHKPLVQQIGEVLVVNPGSLSRPRQADRTPSYVMMHVEEGKTVACELKYLPD